MSEREELYRNGRHARVYGALVAASRGSGRWVDAVTVRAALREDFPMAVRTVWEQLRRLERLDVVEHRVGTGLWRLR